MGKSLLVINVDIREMRVAVIENGIIVELHLERESSRSTLGNIYLGKVSRVLPGMQAAFIDVGLERAAFLHVEDLIRPDDFEAYLSGHRRDASVDKAPLPPHLADAAPSQYEEPEEVRSPEREDLTFDDAASDALPPDDDVAIELPTAAEVMSEPSGEEVFGSAFMDAASDEIGPDAGDLAEGADDALGEENGRDELDDIDAPGHARDAFSHLEPAGETAPAEDDLAGPDGGGDEGDEGLPQVSVEGSEAEGEMAAAPQETEEDEPAADAGPGAPADGNTQPVAMVGAQARRGARGRGRVRRSGRTSDRRAPAAQAAAPPVPIERPMERPMDRGAERGPAYGRQADRRGPARGPERGDRYGRDRERGPGRAPPYGRDMRDMRDPRSGGDMRFDPRQPAHLERGRPGARMPQRGPLPKRTQASHEPPRVSKATPIRDVIREGQEIMVQISKEPIGTKGARVTSHISLPGRYVVYLPTVDHIGISKRIGSEKERARLREAVDAMKPPQGGIIVRTLAEGLTKKQLKADIGYLVRLWGEIAKRRESGLRAPAVLYTELDLVLRTARDLFTDDIEKIVIDNHEEYLRLKRFVEVFMPERADAVEYYNGDEPIFDAYGIEDEIQRALARKVPLPSGGYLIIDQAEALTAIDVNTGRFVGKGSRDLEETILTTNLEAVEEIAYQLRFRNIGGLIILDLIDMERASNREKVRRRLEDLLSKDKAKTTLNRISDLGLIEMTRKRTRESLGRTILEPCFYCDGTGQLQSKQTVAYEILRQIRRERMNLPGYSVIVNANPAIIDFLKGEGRTAVQEAERLFMRRIELVPHKEYHIEQFDLQGR